MDVDKISSRELEEYVHILIGQYEGLAMQEDLLASYIMTLKDNANVTKRAFFEGLYYLTTTSCEIRLFLESMQVASKNRSYTNLYKYLAILLYENIDTIPRIINKINRNSADEINVQRVKAARKRFSKDLRIQIALLELDELLEKIRNHAGAHHLDAENNISYLLDVNSLNRTAWGNGKDFYHNSIVALGVYMCIFINNLAEDLKGADQSRYINALDDYVEFIKNNTEYLAETVKAINTPPTA